MRNLFTGVIFPVLISLIGESQMFAGALSELNPYLLKTVSWKCTTLEQEVPVKIYFSGGETGPDGAEVIVYLKNRAWDRIGRESDLSILNDYIRNNFIVVTVDFGHDERAISPRFDEDLHRIFRAVYGYGIESLLSGLDLVPREYRCFFLPEGYRVATDLVYWEIDKHAAHGTMEYIMKSYNEDIVPKLPGLKPVSSPGDMEDRYGNSFDFTVKMDIVYPSQAKKDVPAVVYSAWQGSRNPNGEPIGYLPHFAGFTTRGYAYVVMGHCFNPSVVHYFHYSKFTLDAWNGLACYTSAMRYINAHASQYGIDAEHIGMFGHSKGQYAVTRLSDPDHENGEEVRRFEGFPEGSPEPQPWQGYPSKLSAGYQSMGMGLFEWEYITPDYVPTLVACGEDERELISRKAHPAFVKRLEELDVNHVNLFMQGLGHHVPYGYDQRMGVDRYQLVHDFFDRYLKVEDKLPPVVLVIYPRNNEDRSPPGTDISIQFAPAIDERSITRDQGIMISRVVDNREIEGTWKASHGSTRFTFKPQEPFADKEKYRIVVTTKVRDKAGTHVAQEQETSFRVVADSPMRTVETPTIDDQEWMVENLDVGFFRNGDPIPEARTDEEWIQAGREGRPAFCYYQNKRENGDTYGRLYNWPAVADPRGLAPEGWRVAGDDDWRRATDFLGGEDAAGTKMKNQTGWELNGNGTNESGFAGLPGGCRDRYGAFMGLGEIGFWWTSSQKDKDLAWYRCIDRSPHYVYRTNYRKENGFSVRCVRETDTVTTKPSS